MTVPKPKKDVERDATFAKGGSTRMAKPQAAGPAKPGVTGKTQTAAPGKKRAFGGPAQSGLSVSTSANAGHTSPPRKGNLEHQNAALAQHLAKESRYSLDQRVAALLPA